MTRVPTTNTTQRPLQVQDIQAADIPIRNIGYMLDGGSWSAEVYIDGAWVKAAHDRSSKTTNVGGFPAHVEVTIKIG